MYNLPNELPLSYSPAFQRDQLDSRDFLLIIQCDSGDSDGDLIACARYRIYDEGVKSMKQNSILECKGNTHVLFVIHLPQQTVHSSFVGFQGDPWVSAHIDDLRHMNSDIVPLSEAMHMPISHLFIRPDSEHGVSHDSEQIFMETAATKEESLAEGEIEKMQADETMDDANKDGLFETEPSTHHVSGSDMVEIPHLQGPVEQIPPPVNQSTQEPMEHLETFMDPMTLDVEESMEQSRAPEKPDEEMSESEHIRELPEPMMERYISEQPQPLAQPRFHPKPKTLKKSGYYLRLHGCIQAAASRLQDSAKNKERATDRVKLLVDLIPSSPALNLGRLISPVTR